jgi:class 3 adenylate cyclase
MVARPDERRVATVLFADLVGFTRRSRQVSPAQVVATLNRLFSAFEGTPQRVVDRSRGGF